MTIFDTIFIFIYLLCGYAAFVFMGNHFGRNYAIAGFFAGYILAWLFLKRLIGLFVPTRKPSREKNRKDKLPPSSTGK
jgi:membrane associated rhomboid family serine protease